MGFSYLNPGELRASALGVSGVAPDGRAHVAVFVPFLAVPDQATLLAVVRKLVTPFSGFFGSATYPNLLGQVVNMPQHVLINGWSNIESPESGRFPCVRRLLDRKPLRSPDFFAWRQISPGQETQCR